MKECVYSEVRINKGIFLALKAECMHMTVIDFYFLEFLGNEVKMFLLHGKMRKKRLSIFNAFRSMDRYAVMYTFYSVYYNPLCDKNASRKNKNLCQNSDTPFTNFPVLMFLILTQNYRFYLLCTVTLLFACCDFLYNAIDVILF